MANEEIQPLASTVNVEFNSYAIIENGGKPPIAPNVNDNNVPGNPEIPGKARLVKGTSTEQSNDSLAHVCDFVSDIQKNINLKKYIKSAANQIRKAIRAVLKALGLTDATGEVSWLANTLKTIAREVDYINKQILQPVIEFEQYVVAYIAKLRAIIAWISSLPAKFLALLQECLARLIKLIQNIFNDIGAGLSEGFTGGPSDYDQIIKEAKNLANAASTTVKLGITAAAGAVNIAGAATAGLLIPTSQAELDAANKVISSYESPDKPPAQNKSSP